MNKNNNKKYASVFGIFALVIVTTAASFAFFTYSRVGQTTTTITSGDIEFSFKEGESAGLANAFPVSDSVGANDTSEEYTFTVNLKSSSTSNKMNYNVYLLDANDESQGTSYFNNEQIKFALIKDNAFVAGTSSSSGVKLSEIDGFTAGERHGEGLVLDNQEIVSGKTDEYKLRIWISDDVNYSNTELTDDNTDVNNDAQTSNGKYNSFKYSLKVKVTSVVDISTAFNNLNITGRNISVDLSDPNGLSAYAITQSSEAPGNDGNEWINFNNNTSKSNVVRTSNEIINAKTIAFKVGNYKKYYLHVKNILNEITTKELDIVKGSPYEDGTGANIPKISTGMIPVTYDGENWIKADETEKWYNHDEQWWANVVTVSESSREKYMSADYGEPISMGDINTMWVWVPRYEYETITSTTATEINVNFLTGTESNKTDNYITHPAFTFGDDELTGIWVAKFEASSNTTCTAKNDVAGTNCDITSAKIKIIPNVTSWRGIRISTMDLNSRAMNDAENIYGFLENEVDTHMMKNIEWGVIAYLSQSKYGKYGNSNYEGANKEIYQNRSTGYITGMSNGTPSQTTTVTQIAYNVEGGGTGASTTGNIYGIYDMSGGASEYVMGIMKDKTSDNPMSGNADTYNFNSGFSGKVYNSGAFKQISGREWPELKYYDLYEYGTTENDAAAYNRYKTGDATTETKEWYGDSKNFVFPSKPWFLRGGHSTSNNAYAGIFSISNLYGHSGTSSTFRPVLVQK